MADLIKKFETITTDKVKEEPSATRKSDENVEPPKVQRSSATIADAEPVSANTAANSPDKTEVSESVPKEDISLEASKEYEESEKDDEPKEDDEPKKDDESKDDDESKEDQPRVEKSTFTETNVDLRPGSTPDDVEDLEVVDEPSLRQD